MEGEAQSGGVGAGAGGSSGPAPAPGDAELLARFCDGGDEGAFRRLVERYLGLVFGTAHRRTGDRARAEDVSQIVFTVLARKAVDLRSHPSVAGWLVRTAIYEAARSNRNDANRRKKMESLRVHTEVERAAAAAAGAAGSEARWAEALPHLDEAMAGLPDSDQRILFLRYYERRSFREIGAVLAASDDTCQKRTRRAVEKLSRALSRRGVALPVAAVASGLTGTLAPEVSAHLTAAGVAAEASAGASAVPQGALVLNSIQTMAYSKYAAPVVAGVLVCLLGGGGGFIAGRLQASGQREATGRLSAAIASALSAREEAEPYEAGSARHGPGRVMASGGPQAGVRTPLQILRSAAAHLREGTAEARRRAVVDLHELRAADREVAVDFLASLGDEPAVHGAIARHVVELWSESDPSGAVAFAQSSIAGREGELAVRAAVESWAGSEPEAAWAWFLEGFGSTSRPSGLAPDGHLPLAGPVLRGWLAGGGRGFDQLVNELPPGFDPYLYRAIGDAAASGTGRREALAAVGAIADPARHIEAVEAVAERWGRADPASAAAWVEAVRFSDPGLRRRAVLEMAEQWVEHDRGAGIRWLWNQLPDERDTIVAGLVPEWVEADPGGAASWLEEVGLTITGEPEVPGGGNSNPDPD